MRHLFSLIAAFVFATVAASAQIYMIDSFSLSSSDGGFGIYVDINCEEWTELYFDMDTDDPAQKTRMQLSSKEVRDLEDNLNSAMRIFEAWQETSDNNSMSLLAKKMPLKMDKQEIFFIQDDKWHLSEGVELFVTFFVDYDGNCHAILETGPLKSKEVVGKGFSYGSSFSPNGRWNMAWARSETTMTRYGNKAYLTFTGRNEVDSFISHLIKAIEWKDHNREMGDLLVRPKKN